jgi:hypothetical protein
MNHFQTSKTTILINAFQAYNNNPIISPINMSPQPKPPPLFPPYTGPKPTLLPQIKALPSELCEQIFMKLLEFHGWEDKMPNLIICFRRCRSEKALYHELLELFYREITFRLHTLNNWKLNGITKQGIQNVRKLEVCLKGS